MKSIISRNSKFSTSRILAEAENFEGDSAFSFNSEKMEAMKDKTVADLLKVVLSLKIELKQERKMNKTMLNNLKAVAYKESISFLKEKALKVTDIMTTIHRKFLQ